MTIRLNTPLVATAVTASFLSLFVIWRLSQRKKVFIKVAKVKKVFCYPFKSLNRVELNEIQLTKTGVQGGGAVDRSFMLVDGRGTMITRIEEPSLVFTKLEISGKTLIITADGMESPLVLSLKDAISPNDKIITCSILGCSIKGVDCGDDAAAWFQKYLKRTDVRVVKCSSALEKRFYNGRDAPSGGGQKSDIFFQNKDALHIVSVTSVDDLNKRLKDPVSELNFRPNIVVEDCHPFAEDDWKFLSFPDGTELEVSGPCNRCTSTTVDTIKGVKTNKEPLLSMRKFRIPKDKKLAKQMFFSPCFGILCNVDKPGSVNVGDDVYAVVQKGLYEYSVKS